MGQPQTTQTSYCMTFGLHDPCIINNLGKNHWAIYVHGKNREKFCGDIFYREQIFLLNRQLRGILLSFARLSESFIGDVLTNMLDDMLANTTYTAWF